MTTFFNFTPSNLQLFQFQPVLDGQIYNVIVPWSLAGRRYYVNCYALDGTRVFSLPLIGSPTGVDIISAEWSNGFVTMETDAPHGYVLGSTIPLSISGMVPDVLNGDVSAFITGRSQFQFPLALDPGDVVTLGVVNFDINIAGGYFTSKLVYRPANQQFEVSP